MKNFFYKNKICVTLIVAAVLIAASFLLAKTDPPPQSAKHLDYTEAPNHVGEYACVSGKIDHVYTSQRGTVFLDFCPDYKTCPFGVVIFNEDAHKFPNPEQYEGKTLEITGLIKSYQGRPEIVLNTPDQIKIPLPPRPSSAREAPPVYTVVEVIDGDTIKVDIGEKIVTVRLIGIDAFGIAHPKHPKDDYFGPEAAQYANKLLENQLVYLIPDPMQSNRDRYDRLLRYVFLEDGTLVNAKLIEGGYAYNYIYEPFQFMKQFDYLEKQAKENRLGIWSKTK
jgi:endonuclease YncB( thermonuclease family)